MRPRPLIGGSMCDSEPTCGAPAHPMARGVVEGVAEQLRPKCDRGQVAISGLAGPELGRNSTTGARYHTIRPWRPQRCRRRRRWFGSELGETDFGNDCGANSSGLPLSCATPRLESHQHGPARFRQGVSHRNSGQPLSWRGHGPSRPPPEGVDVNNGTPP